MNIEKKFDWRKIVDVDIPKSGPITEETREDAIKYGKNGGLRHMMTNEEYEIYKKKILSQPLP